MNPDTTQSNKAGKTVVTLVPLVPESFNGAPSSPEFQRLCFERMKLGRRHFLYTMASPPYGHTFPSYPNQLGAFNV